MVLKMFKAVWFLSMLASLAVLLFNYASFPRDLVVQQTDASQVLISKEVFFYVSMALLAFINVLVFIIAKLYAKQPDFRTWFYGLVIAFNIFFIIATSFINVFNSNEKFNYNNIAVAVYGSVVLLIGWTVAWPIYIIYRNFFAKQSISEA